MRIDGESVSQVFTTLLQDKRQCYIKLNQQLCDDYFEKAVFVNTDNQLYKQAGNGVTVNVVEAIGQKIKEYENN